MLDWLFGSPLAVGSPAPDFSVPDHDGSRVTLQDYRGRNVVLVFYPADNTSVCTKQLCEFRDRHKFPFPLLYDRDLKVARLYQAAGRLLPRRTVYLIGPDGVIRYAKRGKPAPADVLAAAV